MFGIPVEYIYLVAGFIIRHFFPKLKDYLSGGSSEPVTPVNPNESVIDQIKDVVKDELNNLLKSLLGKATTPATVDDELKAHAAELVAKKA